MYKNKKILAFGLLTLYIFILSSSIVSINVLAEDLQNVSLTFDPIQNNNIPKSFRKTSDLSNIKDRTDINIEGLDKLNISGSKQFSGYNLPLLIDAIGTTLPITVVDLRQESHGFINGFAVSWTNLKNNANNGLTREQVLNDEANKLKSIQLKVPITLNNHTKEIIVPTIVEDENKLVNSKSLNYNRIPVTDGEIPTDDMVDYFIEFVKNQPENSWLHFHCKEGIGRTGTFMIMYDMLKNHKVVSADEIMKRQVALADYNEKEIKSFYSAKRLDFLNKFYDYCKISGDSFNIKWSEWIKSKGSNYIKNAIVPTFLYIISQESMTKSERTMVASLQGLVNGHCSSQIYTITSSEPDYKIWLDDLKNNYKVRYKQISNPWQLLDIYKKYINGYVLYSDKIFKDPSINNASSLASISRAIVVNESIESKVRHKGIVNIIGDCRNTDESWAYTNLWDKGLNHSIVIQLSAEKDAPLRDYAIMTNSLVFYENSVDKTNLRDKIFSSMEDNSICLGWGPDEFINVSTASKYGVSVVPADWSYNLTTLSAFPSLSVGKQPTLKTNQEGDFHYVTFIMSDGDNQQWYLGNNYSSTKWFGNPNNDKLNLGWTISPSLFYLAPTVFNLYYKSLINENRCNNFIVAPSGNGYVYPSKFKREELSLFTSTLNDYMEKVDEDYVAIIDDSSFNNMELWNNFTEKSSIQGLFYLDYHRHDNYKGKILWSNNKPIVSCRDLVWDKLENEEELVKRINDRVKKGQVNVHNANAYTFVYVHVWSKDVDNVKAVVSKLNQNHKVKIVSPKMFMELIKRNVSR